MGKRIIGFIFIMLLNLAGCGLETKTLSEFYGRDLDRVTKIVILDGSTGYKKTINDSKVIDEFINEIKDIKFIPEDNQEKRDGYRYAITLFEKGEKTFQFTPIEIDDHYYHTEPDIHHILDSFYMRQEVKEGSNED
jgi:hypothetical protein